MEWIDNFFTEEFKLVGFDSKPYERTKTEVDFMVGALELTGAERILDLCCGVGRHSVEFAKRGFQVVGLDYTSSYLDIARAQARRVGVSANFVEGDMRKIPFVRTVDAIINFFTSFGYFNDRDNFKVLQEIARVLKDKGKFLLETANRDAILKGFQPNIGEQAGDIFLLQKNRFDRRTSRIITDWIYFKDERIINKTKSELRLYSYHEIDDMLGKVGMKIIKEFGGIKGEDFRFDSNRLILVAQKS